MKQDFFNAETSKHLLLRLQKLTAAAKPIWGVMSPAQMLKHLQLENDLALGNYKGRDPSNFFREWAFKQVIKGNMPLPNVFSKWRMVPAILELNVIKSGVTVGHFEEEKEKLFTQFEKLLQAKTLGTLHPGIGKMNRGEWGFFYAWHTDYHLKQFGL